MKTDEINKTVKDAIDLSANRTKEFQEFYRLFKEKLNKEPVILFEKNVSLMGSFVSFEFEFRPSEFSSIRITTLRLILPGENLQYCDIGEEYVVENFPRVEILFEDKNNSPGMLYSSGSFPVAQLSDISRDERKFYLLNQDGRNLKRWVVKIITGVDFKEIIDFFDILREINPSSVI